MSVGIFDPAANTDRALDYATKNLRIEKLLIQVGLDPSNVTYDAIFNRLLDIALVNITFGNVFAVIGGIFLSLELRGSHRRADAGPLHRQHRIFSRVCCAGWFGAEILSLSPGAADQRRAPCADSKPGEKGEKLRTGYFVIELAQALHDAATL